MGPKASLDTVVKRNSQPLPGLEPPIIQPVAQRSTTELFRLTFKRYYIHDVIEIGEFCANNV